MENTVSANALRDIATDTTIAAAANKITYGGGLAALLGGLSANEIAAYGGLLIALVSAIVQVYYKRKANRRAEELHALIISGKLRPEIDGD